MLSSKKIALSIPCFIDQFYPNAAIAVVKLFDKLGIKYSIPTNQSCCGQPMANTGFENEATNVYTNYVEKFEEFDVIIMLSGSCTHHVKDHYDIISQSEATVSVKNNILDFVEFMDEYYPELIQKLHLEQNEYFHFGCHSLRGLRLGCTSETNTGCSSNKNLSRLDAVADECCGFGGSFSNTFHEISTRMGEDKLENITTNGFSQIISSDMSCIMHLDAIARKKGFDVTSEYVAERLLKII